jgi:hypothetical protein
MKALIPLVLCGLNVALLVSNCMLAGVLRTATRGAMAGRAEREALQKETRHLEVVRARLEDKLSLFSRLSLGALPEAPREQPATPTLATRLETVPDERSELLSMALLSPEDWAHLKDLRSRMPPILREDLLLGGDVSALLADGGWNPRRRALESDEKEELQRLMEEYRFFARTAPYERGAELAREARRMREAGAYVDLQLDADAHVPGLTVSFGERPPDRPEIKRIFYFSPEDYPHLYHEQKVEQQQSFRAFVEAYYLINGAVR